MRRTGEQFLALTVSWTRIPQLSSPHGIASGHEIH